MVARVENINPKIVRECREQIGLSVEAAVKKVPGIKAIEAGEKKPTFKQLDTLAELCRVPRWVFIADKLPVKYLYEKTPAFRKFSHESAVEFGEHKTRSVVVYAEQLRELILELREDQNEPINEFHHPFSPPKTNASPANIAEQTRRWLGAENSHLEFFEWRQLVEAKNIFVFMTGKYPGALRVGKEFRGFTVYNPLLPTIVINDSDAQKAQSFTLWHELGHVLRKETAIDSNPFAESWCNEFAAHALMPDSEFQSKAENFNLSNLNGIKSLAERFKVSPDACLVKALSLQLIAKRDYNRFASERKKELANMPKGFAIRRRSEEVIRQYGDLFSRTVAQAHYNGEIGLHKFCQLFGLRRAVHAMEILEMLK